MEKKIFLCIFRQRGEVKELYFRISVHLNSTATIQELFISKYYNSSSLGHIDARPGISLLQLLSNYLIKVVSKENSTPDNYSVTKDVPVHVAIHVFRVLFQSFATEYH